MKHTHITLAHGSGGLESHTLIQELIGHILGESLLSCGEDAGIFGGAKQYAISTDSYVVSPIFFPGGDIGKLCVCGSSNDVSVRGAIPRYMSLGLMIEEGFAIKDLERILISIKKEISKTDIKILSGDTKVVPKAHVDRIFINTTTIGEMQNVDWHMGNIQEGDDIIINAPIGTHGAVIFCARNALNFENQLQSDCAQLYPLLSMLYEYSIHTVRDATRGGVAAVLNEWCQSALVEIEIMQEHIPISQQVRGVCEILGLEALNLANEGVCVIAAPHHKSADILKTLQAHPLGQNAHIIGRVSRKVDNIKQARVILINAWGGKCYVEYPQGELLPRIC